MFGFYKTFQLDFDFNLILISKLYPFYIILLFWLIKNGICKYLLPKKKKFVLKLFLFYLPKISLSQNPNYPCNIIKFKSINIMLDCSLDLSTLMAFLPLPLVQSDHFNSLATYNPPNTVAGQFLDSVSI